MEREQQFDTLSNSEYLDAESEDGDVCKCNVENSDEIDVYVDSESEEQNKRSIISEIRDEVNNQHQQNHRIVHAPVTPNQIVNTVGQSSSNRQNSSDENLNIISNARNTTTSDVIDDIDYIHDADWRSKKKHIFILSEAGKPIYSLHGNENKLASIFGIIQALVSFVQHGQDTITSIHTKELNVVFLIRNNLILVAVSRCKMSVTQLQIQLSDVYNQIVSTLTYINVTKIFEKRKNFDLRRLLAGSERLMEGLICNNNTNKRFTNNLFSFLTNSVMVLPMQASARTTIANTIRDVCSKIRNLVFAVLIGNNCLISLVRMKKYCIHPADLRIIFNLVECSESFKSSENWTPICLPRFDMNGYLHAHISYLNDECQACLLLLSVDKDDFFTLSEAKRNITDKMARSHSLDVINDSLLNGFTKCNRQSIGIQELRHFLYKPKSLAQLYYPELMAPYNSIENLCDLEDIYCNLVASIRNKGGSLKLLFKTGLNETVLAWTTSAYELYAVFEPVIDRNTLIKYVDKLIKWISKEYDTLFIRNHPTF